MAGGKHLLPEGDSNGLIEDLRFPSQGINPPGGISDPDRDNLTGLFLFSATGTEVVAGVAQMPHGWLQESFIYPHIHIRATNGTDPGTGPNNVVQWTLSYRWYNLNDPLPATYTSDTQDFILPPHNVTEVNSMAHFTPIDGTGMIESSLLEWRLARIGGNAADTYPDDCVLVEFDLHYFQNKFGTSFTVS